MNNSGVQRIVPIALVLIIIAVVIAAVVSVGRGIFGGEAEPVTDTGKEALLNTSLDRSVRMTVRGPITADETFRSYTITVAPSSRTLTTYQGYLANQLDTVDLGNNSKSYTQFVYALDRARLVEGDELSGEANDMRGICSNGRLYVYEVMQASNTVKTLWTTTCGNARGSLRGSNQTLLRLFQAQVPDSAKVINKIDL